jgi:hypothetical protein
MTHDRPATFSLLAVLSALALTACSNGAVKETLGLDRAAPDEFRVISRPPLSVPPQFTLRPPANSDLSPNQLSADRKARSLISGEDANPDSIAADTAVVPVEQVRAARSKSKTKTASSGSSSADSAFLQRAGAQAADPTVRDQLIEEKFTDMEKKESRPWWKFFSGDEEKKDVEVDAKKEAARIRKNEDEGKPVTEGKTPEVKPGEEGLLDSIFSK